MRMSSEYTATLHKDGAEGSLYLVVRVVNSGSVSDIPSPLSHSLLRDCDVINFFAVSWIIEAGFRRQKRPKNPHALAVLEEMLNLQARAELRAVRSRGAW